MRDHFFGHFGLQHSPFHISPDADFFVPTSAHHNALNQLAAGIENRLGFMLLTGDPGTGKTTLLYYLLDWLRRLDYSSAYIFHSRLTSTDLLEFVLRDFGVPFTPASKSDMRAELHRWLSARRQLGDRPVLIIDEAQDLSRSALKEIYRLLHLEKQPGDLLQVILAGQLPINQKMHEAELTHLRQCLRCRCRLSALTLEETAGLIASRLRKAAAPNVKMFPAETVQTIHGYAQGAPRIINTLCENALLEALAIGQGSVAPEDISEMARRLELDEPMGVKQAPVHSTFGRLIRFPGPILPDPAQSTEGTQESPEPIETPEPLGVPVSARSEPPISGRLESQVSPELAGNRRRFSLLQDALNHGSAFLSRGADHVVLLGRRLAHAMHHLWLACGSWQRSVKPAVIAILVVYGRAVNSSPMHATRRLVKSILSWKPPIWPARVTALRFIDYWRGVRQSLVADWRRFVNSVSYWWPARARNANRMPLRRSTRGPIAITKTAHQPLSARGRRRLPTSVARKGA